MFAKDLRTGALDLVQVCCLQLDMSIPGTATGRDAEGRFAILSGARSEGRFPVPSGKHTTLEYLRSMTTEEPGQTQSAPSSTGTVCIVVSFRALASLSFP